MHRSTRVALEPLLHDQHETWNRLLATSRDATVYASSNYLDLFSAVTGCKVEYFVARRGEMVIGGLPLVSQQTRLGQTVLNRYFLALNGPIVADEPKRSRNELDVLQSIAKYFHSKSFAAFVLNCSSTLMDFRPFQCAPWRLSPSYTYVMPLTDLDTRFENVEKDQRRKIRHAKELGVVVERSKDPQPLIDLHLETHRRTGAPLYLPPGQMQKFFAQLITQHHGQIYQARLGDSIHAAQLVLTGPFSGTHTVCAGTSSEGMQSGAAPLLRWEAFRELAAQGYLTNDLTGATLNSVSHFKSQLGPELRMGITIQKRPSAIVRGLSFVRRTATFFRRESPE